MKLIGIRETKFVIEKNMLAIEYSKNLNVTRLDYDYPR